MNFEFSTAARIVFGSGSIRELASAARCMGARTLLVTGATPARAQAHLDAPVFSIAGEPTIDQVRAGVEQARAQAAGAIVAIGGGSAIDAGKAIAALAANPGDVLDYLEVIGKGQPLARPSLPFIAVPTTAGTGSEVTRNAVLASPQHRVKASLRGQHMLPRLAIVDPDLTLDLPPAITASTGLDALTQLIEPYVSARANAMVDTFCIEGMRRAAGALPRVWRDPHDRDARTDMSMASLLGGMALANAALGVIHGFAAPIGGMFAAPHGAVCAALLPHGMEANIRAAQGETLRRYETVARILTGVPGAVPADGVRWVADLCGTLAIPPLRAYGITPAHVSELVAKAAQSSSMKGNPVALSAAGLGELLSRAL